MKTIVVHSTSPCVQCNATYRALDKLKVKYRVVHLDAPENADKAAAARYLIDSHPGTLSRQMPLVIVNDGHTETMWSGFQPDKIAEHCKPEAAAA
ncbi:glutaredoxin family protein [Zhihengliuella halotolerans]|uniref:glutaredoxin family protein n=1 Tax=Zhihengliuella halotolerans TaxID=370736 RepID=UPI000C80019B|nr:glutaredoxin family protein [Zhihengliuella halotolerans]